MAENLKTKLMSFGMSARRFAASFLSPAKEITQADTWMYGAGATTVASLLTSGKRQARTRQVIYQKWSEMEGDPLVSSALKLQVTSALGGHETSGNTVFIEKNPKIGADQRKGKIVEEISKDLTPLLNRIAFTMAYTGAAFGDAYARIYTNSSGVVDIYTDEMVRPPLVQPFERASRTVGFAVYVGERNFERLDISQLARLKMPRTQWVPQYGVVEKSLRLALTEDDVDNLPVMPSMVGGSMLYNAEPSYDNLIASLLGLVGQRWIDSIDEQILMPNLESMTRAQQERFVSSLKSMLQASKERAERAVRDGMPIMERIRHIIPVFNEKQMTSLAPANGGGTNRTASISVDDVLLHAKMMAGALGTDLAMLGFADQLSGGLGEGGFFRVSAQAAENARTMRNALAELYNGIIDIHTLKRYGMVFGEHERPWTINFYGSISALAAEQQKTRSDAMNAGMMLVQTMQGFKDMGADQEMMEAFLSKTLLVDEDLAKQYSAIVKAPNANEPPNNQE
ncbi:hypothetical protein F6R98_10655 [Candidatus Methylospira mobilis]|uniref:Phage portal protein n=1 Tax=Candidatus Methylospira mobilis TaxID=1808979 RepID=A0A5Q0BLM3_9GAMM|nr:hypothetical protein [Candidatus Methylospira mobilis]QFY43018.1 hypothetical protein F6R98_10655 [Candidatus Methylospira mobilis]